MSIIQKPSPHTSGPRSKQITHIVLHIMDGSLVGTDSWFLNPTSKVSAHYGIGKKGEVHQYVPDTHVAWHAGRIDSPSVDLPSGNPNQYTIGIEHEGKANEKLPLELYVASARLIRGLCKAYNIPVDSQHILLHREIYSKKTCPGTLDRGLLLQLVQHNEPE